MSNLKKYAKYILFIIGGYILTNFLIFVGFNASYKNIRLKSNLPQQVSIDKAEATKTQARIYGHVQNKDNNLKGKYIKISVFNSSNEKIGTDYLKIDNLGFNENKLFIKTFTSDKASSYEISIVDSE